MDWSRTARTSTGIGRAGITSIDGVSHDHGEHATNRRRLAVAFAITAAILVTQVVGAVVTGSLALLVDAGHMLTDAGGLLMALVAASLMLRPATSTRTWGYLRTEVLAAAAQAAVLLAVGVYALIEGVRRLTDPPEVASTGLLVFGIIGLAGNVAALLVLAGGPGDDSAAVATAIDALAPAARARVIVPGFVNTATKHWLLRRAAVLAYPSLYEGFGFPVLEANSAGTPVVASRVGSLPEVAGEAARLVDERTPEAFAAALTTVLSDTAARDALITAGARNLRRFDWQRAADGLVDLYRRAIAEHT